MLYAVHCKEASKAFSFFLGCRERCAADSGQLGGRGSSGGGGSSGRPGSSQEAPSQRAGKGCHSGEAQQNGKTPHAVSTSSIHNIYVLKERKIKFTL